MVTFETAQTNYLLGALDKTDLERIKGNLTEVKLDLGTVLAETGDILEFAYFPTTAIISLLYIMENGATAEIGITGNDGFLGLPLILGGETTTSRAVIQSAGSVLKLKASLIKEEFQKGGRFQELLLRYTQAFMTQVSQTAVCNRLHPIEQQLCRWVLLSHDRLQTDQIEMTHDLISNMLGVRREGITLAAKKLADRKLIKNSRGNIEVLDRKGLEAASCECYEIVNSEYNRLLGRGISRTYG